MKVQGVAKTVWEVCSREFKQQAGKFTGCSTPCVLCRIQIDNIFVRFQNIGQFFTHADANSTLQAMLAWNNTQESTNLIGVTAGPALVEWTPGKSTFGLPCFVGRVHYAYNWTTCNEWKCLWQKILKVKRYCGNKYSTKSAMIVYFFDLGRFLCICLTCQ